jgi:kynurenine formamidase
MNVIDLSQPLHEGAPVCPAYPMPTVEHIRGVNRERWEVEMVTMAVHSGTHMDAPSHKLKQWKGFSDFPLTHFHGKAVIADFRDLPKRWKIRQHELERRLPRNLTDRFVLIATGWGYLGHETIGWAEEVPHISSDAAQWLVDKKIRAVGIDHWTIGGPKEPEDSLTHVILMAKNIFIIENMRFPDEVFALRQPFEFWTLPIHMPKFSGAFCRPVAIDRSRATP